jgi:hypothetical protein
VRLYFLNLTSIQRDRKSSNRVVKVLMELGFVSKVLWIEGKSQKVWYRELSLPNASTLPDEELLSNAQNPATAVLLLSLPTLPNNIGFNSNESEEVAEAVDNAICNSALPPKLGKVSKLGKNSPGIEIHALPDSLRAGKVDALGKGEESGSPNYNLSSSPSPSVTTLHKYKVGDVVTNEKVGRTGTIVEIRVKSTPKGTEYVQYRVDFGFDSCWFEDVVLQAHKTAV